MKEFKTYLLCALLTLSTTLTCFAAVGTVATLHGERKGIFVRDPSDPDARVKTNDIKSILGNPRRVSNIPAQPDEKEKILTAVIGASIVHGHQRDKSYRLDDIQDSSADVVNHFKILSAAQNLSERFYESWNSAGPTERTLKNLHLALNANAADADSLQTLGGIDPLVFAGWFVSTAQNHRLFDGAGGAGVESKEGMGAVESLERHLSANPSMSIPGTVSDLYQRGMSKYQDTLVAGPGIGSDRYKDGRLQECGGRKATWIQDTFDKTEEQIILEFNDLPAPPTWTIDTINKTYAHVVARAQGKSSSKPFTLVKGVSVNYLSDSILGQNCIVQLASQFNYLESPGTNITTVSAYRGDRTQGPQGSIEASATTLYRHAAVTTGKLRHALVNILNPELEGIKTLPNRPWGDGDEQQYKSEIARIQRANYPKTLEDRQIQSLEEVVALRRVKGIPVPSKTYYQNGYLQPHQFLDADKAEFLQSVKANIGALQILPQHAVCEATGAYQLQVFAAAPSFQGKYSGPHIASVDGQICSELVAAQYEAIAKLAVIKSILKPDEVVNLHLTLVGQGAFLNPSEVMTEAFKRVADVVKDYNVHVYIHGYDTIAQDKVRGACAESGITIDEMDSFQFLNAKSM